MIKAVLFDLDGTLLPMNEEEFTKGYFGLICKRLVPLGYDKDKLIQTVWGGTKLMIKNDGKLSNEQVFWNHFASVYGEEKLSDKKLFDDFYVTDFKNAKVFCGENKFAKELVHLAKEKGLKVILASNPVFPRDGMITRAGFVGLEEKDFDYITSYENSHYSKPNPKYYQEILNNNGLSFKDVIFFGNNEVEDFEPATACGIKCFLIGDNINFKENSNLKSSALTYEQTLATIDEVE